VSARPAWLGSRCNARGLLSGPTRREGWEQDVVEGGVLATGLLEGVVTCSLVFGVPGVGYRLARGGLARLVVWMTGWGWDAARGGFGRAELAWWAAAWPWRWWARRVLGGDVGLTAYAVFRRAAGPA
jgi:hypothetical protein